MVFSTHEHIFSYIQFIGMNYMYIYSSDFPTGMSNVVAPMYLTEIAPYSMRGAFGTVHQLAITLGIFGGSVLGLPQILGKD